MVDIRITPSSIVLFVFDTLNGSIHPVPHPIQHRGIHFPELGRAPDAAPIEVLNVSVAPLSKRIIGRVCRWFPPGPFGCQPHPPLFLDNPVLLAYRCPVFATPPRRPLPPVALGYHNAREHRVTRRGPMVSLTRSLAVSSSIPTVPETPIYAQTRGGGLHAPHLKTSSASYTGRHRHVMSS